jgi:hypothetical protein
VTPFVTIDLLAIGGTGGGKNDSVKRVHSPADGSVSQRAASDHRGHCGDSMHQSLLFVAKPLEFVGFANGNFLRFKDTEDLQRPLFRFFLLASYCGVESTGIQHGFHQHKYL